MLRVVGDPAAPRRGIPTTRNGLLEEEALRALELLRREGTGVAEADQALELVRDRRVRGPFGDGQRVRVVTKSGEIEVIARMDATVMRGVCSIPHGHLEANINHLTSVEDMDELGGMALYSAVPIEIEPLPSFEQAEAQLRASDAALAPVA